MTKLFYISVIIVWTPCSSLHYLDPEVPTEVYFVSNCWRRMWKFLIILIHLLNSVKTNMTEQCPDLNRKCFYVYENYQYTLSKKGITYLSAFLEFVFFHIFYFQCLVKHLLKTVLASVWLHRFLEFRGIEIQKIAFALGVLVNIIGIQNSNQGHLTQIWNYIRNFPYIWGIFWGIPYKYPVLWETSKYLKISHLRISI